MSRRIAFPVQLSGVEDFHIEGLERCRPVHIFSGCMEHPWAPTQPATKDTSSSGGHGVKVEPILQSAYTGDVEAGSQAVGNGADVRSRDRQGVCPLMIACQEGHVHFVRFLIGHGAIITQCTGHGRTALFYSVLNNRLDVARLLLESDQGLVNMVDQDGMTVCMFCALHGFTEMMLLLHGFGVDFNIKDKRGRTALMAAAQHGSVEIVKFLVDNGALTSEQSETGTTALLIAISHTHFEVVEILLNGVNVKICDNDGNSPLIMCCSQGFIAVVRQILELDVDINHTNKHGITALMAAVCQGEKDLVKLLTQKKPDMTVQNHFGLTAFDLALLWKKPEINEILLASPGEKLVHTKKQILENKKALIILVFLKDNDLLKQSLKGIKGSLQINELYNDHSLLMIATHSGNLEAVQLLLKIQVDVNQKSSKGASALTIAIAKDHVAVFERLLEYGADINYVDDKGETMLFKCAAEGNLEGVLKLERMGANIDKRNLNGDTPLMAAAQNGHVKIAKYLWKMRAQIDTKNQDNCTALDMAMLYEHHDVAALLNDKHDDTFEEDNSLGQMLMQACVQADTLQVTTLLAEGAPVNFRDPNHQLRTPLMCAAQAGDCTIVEELFKHGASVHVKSSDSETPLVFASLNGHTAIVRSLIKHGGNLNSTDNLGHTPLMCASQNGHVEIVQELVKARALISLKDSNKTSALIFAAQSNHFDIVNYLLQSGFANVDTVDCQGRAALHLAAHIGSIETVKVLLDHDADIDCQTDEKRNTPLMTAVKAMNLEMVRYLVEHGASLCKVDHNGRLAHEFAEGMYLDDIHAYLVEKYAETGEKDSQQTEDEDAGKKRLEKKRLKGEGEKILLDMCANDWGFEDTIKFNVKAGADINCKNDKGHTPILVAAKKRSFKYIPWLMKYGANVNQQDEHGCTPLMYALRSEEYAVVFLMLEEGSHCDTDIQDHTGTTALMVAIQLGMCEIALKMLHQTRDFSLADSDNNTVLSHCAMNPHTEPGILKEVIEKTDEKNGVNCHGNTPLLLAVKHGNTTMVRLLLEQEIDLVHKNHLQEDALIVACHSSVEIMRLMASFKDWFEEDSLEVALQTFVLNNNMEMIDVLLNVGLNINRTYRHGQTLAFFSVMYQNISMLEMILKKGADANHKNTTGKTIAMLACELDYIECVEKILPYLDNTCMKDMESWAAVDIALRGGHYEITLFMKKKLLQQQYGHFILCDWSEYEEFSSSESTSGTLSLPFFDMLEPGSETKIQSDFHGSTNHEPDTEDTCVNEVGSLVTHHTPQSTGEGNESSAPLRGHREASEAQEPAPKSHLIENVYQVSMPGVLQSGVLDSSAMTQTFDASETKTTLRGQVVNMVDSDTSDSGFQFVDHSHENGIGFVGHSEMDNADRRLMSMNHSDLKTRERDSKNNNSLRLETPLEGVSQSDNGEVGYSAYQVHLHSVNLKNAGQSSPDQVHVHSVNLKNTEESTDAVSSMLVQPPDLNETESSRADVVETVDVHPQGWTNQGDTYSSRQKPQVQMQSRGLDASERTHEVTNKVHVHSGGLNVTEQAQHDVTSKVHVHPGAMNVTEQSHEVTSKVHVQSGGLNDTEQTHDTEQAHDLTSKVHVHSGAMNVTDQSHDVTKKVHVQPGDMNVHEGSPDVLTPVQTPSSSMHADDSLGMRGNVHVHPLSQNQGHSHHQKENVHTHTNDPQNPGLVDKSLSKTLDKVWSRVNSEPEDRRGSSRPEDTGQPDSDNSRFHFQASRMERQPCNIAVKQQQHLTRLKKAQEGKDHLITMQRQKLASYEKQIAVLESSVQEKEQKCAELQSELEVCKRVTAEYTQLEEKVQCLEQLFEGTLSENQDLRRQTSVAADQQHLLKEEIDSLRRKLETKEETIASLEVILKDHTQNRPQQTTNREDHGHFKPLEEDKLGKCPNHRHSKPLEEDKLGKWQACACQQDDCPTCVAEKAATATPHSSAADEQHYWTETNDPDNIRAIQYFTETDPKIPGVSRKFFFAFHMSISDSATSDHAHPQCSSSSFSALLFAHKYKSDPCEIYDDFVSDFLFDKVSRSIKEAGEVFELNCAGRSSQLLPTDTILVNGHLGFVLTEERELGTGAPETLLRYIMNIKDHQILLFYRLDDYKVYSVISVEDGQKIVIFDPQWHSMKRSNGEQMLYGAFLYYSLKEVEVIQETINLLNVYGGLIKGKCWLAVVEYQNK